MDICAAVRGYVWRMMEAAGAGMKLLLLDRDTTPIISLAVAQSELLQKEVYAFEILENTGRDPMPHLKAVVFIRPTDDSISRLADELRHPRYAQYYVYLSNAAPKQLVKTLADADESEAVRDLQEFFADYLALTPSLFSLDLPGCISPPGFDWASTELLSRTARSLAAVLLSIRRFPIAIRFSADSSPSRRLAESLNQLVTRERELFDFSGSPGGSNWNNGVSRPAQSLSSCITVLIVDRRQDCITPLVSPWLYVAMAHEHVGLNHNRVCLAESDVEGGQNAALKAQKEEKDKAKETSTTELESIILSPVHDEFFLKNMYLNFGEIGATIRRLVDEFQQRHRQQASVESVSDLRAFVATYPAFRRLSGNVTRHVTLVSELSQRVDKYKLMEISECEQMIASKRYAYEEALGNVKKFCADCRPVDAFRLAAVFALAYKPSDTDFGAIEDILRRRGGWLIEKGVRLLKALVYNYAKDSSAYSAVSSIQQVPRRLLQGLRGVENVFTLHQPKIREIQSGTSSGGSGAPGSSGQKSANWTFSSTGLFGNQCLRPLGDIDSNLQQPHDQLEAQNQNLLVFFIGGITYSESAALLSSNSQPGRIIVGGTNVINTAGFLREVENAVGGILSIPSHNSQGGSAAVTFPVRGTTTSGRTSGGAGRSSFNPQGARPSFGKMA